MSKQRKPADARRKDLELAISRIRKGRSNTNATKLNITTVAKEAGVTPPLIHNSYPDIAEKIRVEQGRSSRVVRDTKHRELVEEKESNKVLRKEVSELRAQVAKLVSINEVLTMENRTLRAKSGAKNVHEIDSGRSESCK